MTLLDDDTLPQNTSNKVRKLTRLPVSTKRLIIALPQHEEIYHIGHVVVPAGEVSVTSSGEVQ